ncbi:MAG: FlgD immunoglobulin-like domain containing protein [Bacteroidales bacterium]
MKQQLLSNFGEDDRFNLMFSRLRIEKAFDDWVPVNEENIGIAINLFLGGSIYSNLPGLLSEGIEMIKAGNGEGSVVLIANSSNFVQYEQANALIKDLKAIQSPLYPFLIADIQNLNINYQYAGNRYYQGQEYLYTNLAKASGGYFLSIRDENQVSTLFNKVLNSIRGMITAFDLYTSPAEGFCYGRFTSQDLQGFQVNQPVTQIGKYFGEPPFVIYLTGIYQSLPFSQLIRVSEEETVAADTSLSKIWHGRYIQELESGNQNNTVIQEILYESLSNRILSKYTAFLCLEPSDTIGICATCQDESRLVGIELAERPDPANLIKLYPNPFSDLLTIEIDLAGLEGVKEATVRIFNITGQLLWQQTERGAGSGPVRLTWNGRDRSGNSQPAGQYIVMVNAGPAVWSMQAVKSE